MIAFLVWTLILAKWVVQLWLERVNRRSLTRFASAPPEALKGIMDEQTYSRSVRYNLAKIALNRVSLTWHTALLLAVLFSGILPWGHEVFSRRFGQSIIAQSAFLFAVGVALSVVDLPLDWFEQFRIEERFGFNTSTQKVWWMDRIKGLILALALGYPLLVLLLKIVAWTGTWWWVWAWAAVLGFQLLMVVLAPSLIMPLFNKFAPLPEGSLRDKLLALAERVRFRAASIQVMDGSRRSRHSNAFFTGFGRLRKIVLFDTLIAQLSEPEIEAVLAHEIGHFKLKHIPTMLAAMALGALAGFALLALLVGQPWLYSAFGFTHQNVAIAFLLFGLLSGVFTFWLSPLANWWSRRCEYQADAFAAKTLNDAEPLRTALRKLNEKNLSNLTPHPAYSRFYYSHPTLIEREEALKLSAA